MSVAETMPGRRTSPLLSNNPFRDKVANDSANMTSRTVSKNPFLDSSDIFLSTNENPTPTPVAMSNTMIQSSTDKKAMSENTREIFDNLSLDDRPKSSRRAQPQMNGTSRRTENMPPRPYGGLGGIGHRPSQSEEDGKAAPSRSKANPLGELDIFADPPNINKSRDRRPRRNSESSVREKRPETEEDRRRRERREKRRPKQPRGMDIIDKLDVTSIYGTGLFHHDGPFDACNPHRNRKNSRQAPMQAFPKDSKNMAIGGSGPVNSSLNLDQIHGVGMEAHKDYNEAALYDEDAAYMRRPGPERSATFNAGFNPVAKAEPLHGEESLGLGTSTFLEGAPASRAAIQRRESENQAEQIYEGGGTLSRKKSLAQKIRAVRPGGNYINGRMTSPEPQRTPTSPLATGKTETSVNPFFKDYDQEYDRKGQQIAFAQEEQQKVGRARAPSSPKRAGLGLERKMTQESVGGEESKSGGGFLSRVKSLKGGRKPKGDKRDVS